MLALLLRIVFQVAFSHLLRLSQVRTPRPMAAAGINYLVAAVGCCAWAAVAAAPIHPQTLWLGGAAGFSYVSSMVLLLPSIRRSGIALTGSLMQLSLMLPVATAIWRFGEYPTTMQALGIALTLVALPILSTARSVGLEPEAPGSRRSLWLPATLFVSSGLGQVLMKEFSAVRPDAELSVFSAALFVAATFLTYAWMWLAKDEGRDRAVPFELPAGAREVGEWPMGLLLGAINILQLVCLLLALRELPGVIVFPVSAAIGIVVNVILSHLFWKEQPPPAGWVAIGMAVVAVVLLNLR